MFSQLFYLFSLINKKQKTIFIIFCFLFILLFNFSLFINCFLLLNTKNVYGALFIFIIKISINCLLYIYIKRYNITYINDLFYNLFTIYYYITGLFIMYICYFFLLYIFNIDLLITAKLDGNSLVQDSLAISNQQFWHDSTMNYYEYSRDLTRNNLQDLIDLINKIRNHPSPRSILTYNDISCIKYWGARYDYGEYTRGVLKGLSNGAPFGHHNHPNIWWAENSRGAFPTVLNNLNKVRILESMKLDRIID